MRRNLIAIATTALVASTVAFAPAVTDGTGQQADTTHEVTFTEDGTATIEGGLPGGVNLTPFTPNDPQQCTDEPDGYCETVLVTVEQPVVDEDPEQIEIGTGNIEMDLTPQVPGSDFDVYVYTSDAEGTRGGEITFSANAPGCTQLCGTAPDPLVLWGGCEGVDECLDFGVSTSDLTGGTKHYLVEVYYFATPAGYTLNMSYERTDGRNFDGTTPDA